MVFLWWKELIVILHLISLHFAFRFLLDYQILKYEPGQFYEEQ
jgi:hypothetical protein